MMSDTQAKEYLIRKCIVPPFVFVALESSVFLFFFCFDFPCFVCVCFRCELSQGLGSVRCSQLALRSQWHLGMSTTTLSSILNEHGVNTLDVFVSYSVEIS